MSNKATLNRLLNDFYPYAKEYLGFDKDADVYFVSDVDNANKPLGKTAYYDPAKREISVYTDNRHPKDIMRSVSHELVHHAQNCRGDLGMSEHTGQGYAQNDEHLREMEREAYEKGNLCFRDWEDGIKANLQPGTIYESRAHRSKNRMPNFKTLNENFKSFLIESDYEQGDEVEIIGGVSAGEKGTVQEPMAGGAVIELEDGTIVKVRDEHIEKPGYMSGEAIQEIDGFGNYDDEDGGYSDRDMFGDGDAREKFVDAMAKQMQKKLVKTEDDGTDVIAYFEDGTKGYVGMEAGADGVKASLWAGSKSPKIYDPAEAAAYLDSEQAKADYNIQESFESDHKEQAARDNPELAAALERDAPALRQKCGEGDTAACKQYEKMWWELYGPYWDTSKADKDEDDWATRHQEIPDDLAEERGEYTPRSPAPEPDVELIEKIAELMASDPEFKMLSRYSDQFKQRAGSNPERTLEAILPDYVSGGDIRKVIDAAKESLGRPAEPVKRPTDPPIGGESDYLDEGVGEGFREGERVGVPKHVAPNGMGEIFRDNGDGTYEVLVSVRGGKKTVTIEDSDIAKQGPFTRDQKTQDMIDANKASGMAGGWDDRSLEEDAGDDVIAKATSIFPDAEVHEDGFGGYEIVLSPESIAQLESDPQLQAQVSDVFGDTWEMTEDGIVVADDEAMMQEIAKMLSEYGDHETQAAGGETESSRNQGGWNQDPEFDQVQDIALTVIEQGGQLMQIATALQDEAFDASVMSGVLVIGDKYFIGKPDKFDISPDEDFREIGPYVLGHQHTQNPMQEGGKLSHADKEWHQSVMDMGKVPDLKGDMGPIPGMEGPFQYASGAVLYYDPKEGKYYDRGRDMYLDNEEAAQLTMENKKMNLREKVVASVMAALKEGGSMAEYGAIDAEDGNPPSKIGQGDPAYMEAYNAVLVARGEEPLPVVQPDQAYLDALQSGNLEEMYDDDDPYADDDPYMASLEAEFPWLADKKKGGRPASAEDEAAAAAAAADAAAAGEFGMGRGEDEEEEPTVMKEEEWTPERSRDDVKYGGQIHLIPGVKFTGDIESDLAPLPPEILDWMYGELESGDSIEDEFGRNYAGGDVQDVIQVLDWEDRRVSEGNKNKNGETKTMRLKTNIFEDENAFTETLRGRVMKRLQELSKGQEEMDLDDDGKIEPEDLAGLRSGKEDEDVGEEAEEKKEESLRDRVRRIVQETLNESEDTDDDKEKEEVEEGKYKREGDDDDGDDKKEEQNEAEEAEGDDPESDDDKKEEQNESEEAEGDDPEAEKEDKEKQEEQIAANPEDFFRKLRNESRTVVKEDWNKNSKSKRSAMLNERLMKSWFNK